ncbi:MAG: 4-(cytidine 5'-diphospho)-2-C-methyl-D-erythritol kinase [Alphaproteobacteria bacterium]|nr:4-(cytidine 5'-diphospho)-2-C-methyl-D-erythritol kinase [Alphaproteobacteria bacterium]NNF23865.1 4-(cytidine 5'-diphospho)-2-C-methyl-D-erythritol kinase [Paracoccaceae bacterium]
MTTVSVFAPAKINLTLHVTGQAPKGYHLLDSLVAFAGVGDRLTVETRGRGELRVTGPEAGGVPTDQTNIIFQTAAEFWPPSPVRFELFKQLPVASGIGGGSADAAAVFRGIAYLLAEKDTHGDDALLSEKAMRTLFEIGADVTMCVLSEPARVRGMGEQIEPVPDLARLPVVLVNPRVPLSTPAVFRALKEKANPPMEALPDRPGDPEELLSWLAGQRNDLQCPAIDLAPEIRAVLSSLSSSEGCAVTRMSGSGATCFGLYRSQPEADAAATALGAAHPDWWVVSSCLDGQDRVAPQLIRATT